MTYPGTIYEAIGGQDTVDQLVTAQYKYVGKHPKLLEIFPKNLQESARKQRLFLTQFFGGPNLYSKERGHPMLRRRHMPFAITPERKDAWLECFLKALDDVQIEEPYYTAILKRISLTAQHMINTLDS